LLAVFSFPESRAGFCDRDLRSKDRKCQTELSSAAYRRSSVIIFFMSEFIPIGHPDALHARSVLVAVGRGQDIGVTYNNIILSSQEPSVTDVYDTSIFSLMKYATLYWPGGNPEHGRKVETIVQGDLQPEEFVPEAARVRRLILGASIGASALARVPTFYRELWGTVDAYAPGVAAEAFKEKCKDLQRPFAVCAISDVTSDSSERSIMHLWYPALAHPESCLGMLKQAIVANGI
jgi:hypothetical protein